MVERFAVNEDVRGSSPLGGAETLLSLACQDNQFQKHP